MHKITYIWTNSIFMFFKLFTYILYHKCTYILASNLIFVLKIIFILTEIHIYINEPKSVCAKRNILTSIQYLCTTKNIFICDSKL